MFRNATRQGEAAGGRRPAAGGTTTSWGNGKEAARVEAIRSAS